MKNQGKFRELIVSLLPPAARLRLVAALCDLRKLRRPFELPGMIVSAKSLLVIASEDPLRALHQIDTIMAVTGLLKKAAVTLVCESQVAGYFRILPGISRVFEYAGAERRLFSPVFSRLGRQVAELEPDVCMLLEESPDLSLLRLVAQSRAPLRAGYRDGAVFPFVNFAVRLSAAPRYLSDTYAELARAIGAPAPRPPRWTASRQALDDVAQLLRDYSILPGTRIAGIDCGFLYREFGPGWTGALVGALGAAVRCTYYCVAAQDIDEAFMDWCRGCGLVVMPRLNTSRLAALLAGSQFLVTGNTVLFQLGRLLGTPAAGVFSGREIGVFCKPDRLACGIAYGQRPDESTVAQVVAAARELAGKKVA